MENSISYEPADIIIHVQGKGIVLREKSLIAFQKSDGRILACGTEADRPEWKDREDVIVMSPFRQGMIADFTAAEKILSYFMIKALGKRSFFKKPAMAVCVPGGITSVEKKALQDALIMAGASELFFTEIPAGEFIRKFPEKFPNEYQKFKITIGITKEESERYVEERLRDVLEYAGQERISGERVFELLRRVEEQNRHFLKEV